jgi:hypothetical protein
MTEAERLAEVIQAAAERLGLGHRAEFEGAFCHQRGSRGDPH